MPSARETKLVVEHIAVGKLKLQSNIVGRSPCAPVSQAYVKTASTRSLRLLIQKITTKPRRIA